MTTARKPRPSRAQPVTGQVAELIRRFRRDHPRYAITTIARHFFTSPELVAAALAVRL